MSGKGRAKSREVISSFLPAFAAYVIDRISKSYLSGILDTAQSIVIFPNVLYITLVKNKGAAFGVFQGHIDFFILAGLTSAVIILYMLVYRKTRLDAFERFSLSLLLGGALGNLTDRLLYGYVIDFIDFRVWPVFNAADIAITVGVGALIVMMVSNILRAKAKKKDYV